MHCLTCEQRDIFQGGFADAQTLAKDTLNDLTHFDLNMYLLIILKIISV